MDQLCSHASVDDGDSTLRWNVLPSATPAGSTSLTFALAEDDLHHHPHPPPSASALLVSPPLTKTLLHEESLPSTPPRGEVGGLTGLEKHDRNFCLENTPPPYHQHHPKSDPSSPASLELRLQQAEFEAMYADKKGTMYSAKRLGRGSTQKHSSAGGAGVGGRLEGFAQGYSDENFCDYLHRYKHSDGGRNRLSKGGGGGGEGIGGSGGSGGVGGLRSPSGKGGFIPLDALGRIGGGPWNNMSPSWSASPSHISLSPSRLRGTSSTMKEMSSSNESHSVLRSSSAALKFPGVPSQTGYVPSSSTIPLVQCSPNHNMTDTGCSSLPMHFEGYQWTPTLPEASSVAPAFYPIVSSASTPSRETSSTQSVSYPPTLSPLAPFIRPSQQSRKSNTAPAESHHSTLWAERSGMRSLHRNENDGRGVGSGGSPSLHHHHQHHHNQHTSVPPSVRSSGTIPPNRHPVVECRYRKCETTFVYDETETRTTCMLRNVPNRYTQDLLLEVLDLEFEGLYDFVYLPIDFRNKCNVGFAFINLVSPHYAQLFHQAFSNVQLDMHKSKKVCQVAWGNIQGLQANIDHYKSSAVLGIPYADYRPVVLRDGKKMEAPLPEGHKPVVSRTARRLRGDIVTPR